MTTENVAVLFTDVVGSTARASSLAPDAADELRRGHFSVLRQAVAETGGAEVKNLGDGLMVVFTSASAALSCAVAMQQGNERDNRGPDPAVGLRVGLSVGEVTREDDDYFGDPVTAHVGVRSSHPVSHSLGGLATVLGRYDDADAYFAKAAELCERVDMLFFAAENDLAWGSMLLARNTPGDVEKARELLTKAQADAAAHGYGYVERRATEALQSTH